MKIQLSKYDKKYTGKHKKSGLVYQNEIKKLYTVNLLLFRYFLVITVNSRKRPTGQNLLKLKKTIDLIRLIKSNSLYL
jgi:hypothetical protein